MTNYQSGRRDPRAQLLRSRAWMLVALSVIGACVGESPVAPRSEPLLSAQIEREANYSFSMSPADRTVRVRFTRVRSDGTESVSAFIARMFATADAAGATKLVLDLRAIRGGDAFLVVPLVKGVLARERFVRHGGLFVIVGDKSFSPGQNAVTQLQRFASPIIIRDAP